MLAYVAVGVIGVLGGNEMIICFVEIFDSKRIFYYVLIFGFHKCFLQLK